MNRNDGGQSRIRRTLEQAVRLHTAGDAAAAIPLYREVVAAEPHSKDGHYNLGLALFDVGAFGEARSAYERCIACDPAYSRVWNNYGNLLRQTGCVEDAEAALRRALELQPDYPTAHLNLGIVLLLQGRCHEGFFHYQWRRAIAGSGVAAFPQPPWRGQPVAGKTVLLHSEQGLGDTVQFARYVPLLAERGARVVLEVPPALIRLMATLPGVASLMPQGQPRPPFDHQAPLGDLPLAFGTQVATIPANVPYLRADPALAAAWRQRLAGSGIKVGLAWSGNPAHKDDRNRSLAAETLLPRLRMPGVTLFSLQKDPRTPDAETIAEHQDILRDLGPHLADLAETAAAIAGLDLVITVDTAIAHLAGALGKPVWVLIPFAPDWRWMLGRETSPWYPNMRLFRQPAAGAWAPALDSLAGALAGRRIVH